MYEVSAAQATAGILNATLSWINPRVGSGNIASIRVSYASNNSAAGSDTLIGTAYTSTDGSVITYIWTGLTPGIYNFTIEPVLGGDLEGATITDPVTTSNVEVYDIGGPAIPAPDVTNFDLIPYADGMTLSWINPERDDIASINAILGCL